MDVKNLISKARAGLILDHPFFGTIALKLKITEDKTLPTYMATDGFCLSYNPKLIQEISLSEIKGVIAHEVMHIAMLHHLREGNRNHVKWNYACDYAINPILRDSGFDLPKDTLGNRFRGMEAEKIYNLLPETNSKKGKNLYKELGIGEVKKPQKGNGQEYTEAELKELEGEAKVMIAQAAQVAKSCGKLPAGFDRLIEDILEPVIPWREVLRRFIQEHAKNDYTWKYPNRRYLYQGLYLPSLYSDEIGQIIVAIDTSGSISNNELKQFTGEISDIVNEVGINEVKVIYCDSKVHNTQSFIQGEPVTLKAKGGGGTDYKPVFSYIEKKQDNPVCLVYLTDGYCSSFPEKAPSYSVLWVITHEGDSHFSPPFGETIKMKD